MAERRIVGLPGPGAWAYLARGLISGREAPGFSLEPFDGPLVLVGPDQSWLEDAADAFAALGPLFGSEARGAEVAAFGEDPRGRLAALEVLRRGARLALAVPQALEEALPSPEAFASRRLSLKAGARLKRSEAEARLAEGGYQRVDFVETPGEFAVRGAVLDFFPLEPLRAIRVLFDEDEIASLRVFDPGTQATREMLVEAEAPPAAAAEGGASGRLADWFGPGALWIVDESAKPALPEGARVYRAGRLLESSPEDLDFGARPNGPWAGGPEAVWAELGRRVREGDRAVLCSLNRGEDRRLQEILEERFAPGELQFLIGPLRQGFRHPALKLTVLSSAEIFGRRYRPASRWQGFRGGGGLRLRELKAGDFVVHHDYGLARYRGLRPVESPGHGVLDCLELEFRGSDRLYCPMTEFGRVQKYSGAEGKRPRLSSLDTRRWEEVKASVREGARELAEQLLKTQAQRASRPGHAFPPASPMEREFAEAFPFEETEDQARAIADVLADMESPHPMDRLVIGDVGFGKTEVAMRAAFKCAAGYRQAAVLVPTTILADQHFDTFSARFADYPVRLGRLTRFQSPGEQKATLKALAAGTVDVVIGTSALLQKGVAFKDLGLVIIDEEHRFGVKDKERLKALRSTVDFLALTATPIPRTLHQAMSGMRAISAIRSAPVGRQPIVTRVGPWDEGAVAHAISEELSRGGQAYFVHNRVRTLPDCLKRLKALLPEARFGLVHGRMKGPEIEAAMWEFFHRRFDVLVASTIIESGLDIPTVNTLLVEDAHEFGLAQLYQLRGRIGREKERAYCYLFFPEGAGELSELSEEARKRLEALREFGDLGAGFRLALRDLEIRGAGELLGARQHGFISAVGADFYAQILEEEMSALTRRPAAAPEALVSFDIQFPAYIPEPYLPDEMARLEFYKRILKAAPAEAGRLRLELEDLCGPAPIPVQNLFELLSVRALAARAGARAVVQKGERIEVFFRAGASVGARAVESWRRAYGASLRFMPAAEGDGLSAELSGTKPLDWLKGFFEGLLGAGAEK